MHALFSLLPLVAAILLDRAGTRRLGRAAGRHAGRAAPPPRGCSSAPVHDAHAGVGGSAHHRRRRVRPRRSGHGADVAFLLQVTPSVWTAYRAEHATGISAGTWLLILGELLCWGTFGIYEADPRLIVLGATGVTASLLVLARIATRRTPAAELIDTVTPATTSRYGRGVDDISPELIGRGPLSRPIPAKT
jgi:hypothetical protein